MSTGWQLDRHVPWYGLLRPPRLTKHGRCAYEEPPIARSWANPSRSAVDNGRTNSSAPPRHEGTKVTSSLTRRSTPRAGVLGRSAESAEPRDTTQIRRCGATFIPAITIDLTKNIGRNRRDRRGVLLIASCEKDGQNGLPYTLALAALRRDLPSDRRSRSRFLADEHDRMVIDAARRTCGGVERPIL